MNERHIWGMDRPCPFQNLNDETLPPPQDGHRKWDLWEVTRAPWDHEGGAPMSGLVSSQGSLENLPPLHSPYDNAVRTQQSVCDPEEEPSQSWPLWHPDLRLWTPGSVRNAFLLLVTLPVCGAWSQQPRWTETFGKCPCESWLPQSPLYSATISVLFHFYSPLSFQLQYLSWNDEAS